MEIQDKYKLNPTGVFIRKYEHDRDYEDVKSWFTHLKKRVKGCPTKDMLSLDGYITEYYNQKVCAGWLYTTNSNIAMIEFVIANPDVKTDIRKESLKKLLTHLEALAKTKGYEILLIITSNKGYSRTLSSYGFERGDVPHYENVKILWPQEH
jgi:hypothetical protein